MAVRPVAMERGVITVSADRIVNPSGAREGRYTAQGKLDPNDLAFRSVVLQAGMPAQVTVSTNPCTMLDDRIAPSSDQVERVLREE